VVPICADAIRFVVDVIGVIGCVVGALFEVAYETKNKYNFSK